MHPRGETREHSKPPTSKGGPPGSEDAEILRSARIMIRSLVAAKTSGGSRRELLTYNRSCPKPFRGDLRWNTEGEVSSGTPAILLS